MTDLTKAKKALNVWFVVSICSVAIAACLSIFYLLAAILINAGLGEKFLSFIGGFENYSRNSGLYLYTSVLSSVFYLFVTALLTFQLISLIISKKRGTPFTSTNSFAYFLSTLLLFLWFILMFFLTIFISITAGMSANFFSSFVYAIPLGIISAFITGFIRYGQYLEEYKKDKEKYAKKEEVTEDEKCV